MTEAKRKRAQAIRGLIEAGWSPPPPTDTIAARILDDIARADVFGQTNDLTAREIGLLQLLADGDTFDTAATRLGLSVETVKDRTKMIRRKLGARNTPHAVAIAFRAGLLDLEAVAA